MGRRRKNYENHIVGLPPGVWDTLFWMAGRIGCTVSDLVRIATVQLIVRYWDPLTATLWGHGADLTPLLTTLRDKGLDFATPNHLLGYMRALLTDLTAEVEIRAGRLPQADADTGADADADATAGARAGADADR